MSKTKIALVAALFLFCAGIVYGAMSSEEAVVDFKKVFDSYPKCIEARKELKRVADEIKTDYVARLAQETDETKRNAIKAECDEKLRESAIKILNTVITEVKGVAINVAKSKRLDNLHDIKEGKKGVDITQDVILALNASSLASVDLPAVQQAKVEAEQVAQTARAKAEGEKAAQAARAKAEAEKAAQEAKAKVETAKPVQSSALVSNKPKSAIEVQFGADYDEPDITRMVKKARKNGLETAYVNAITGKNGKLFCRARVPASSYDEAKAISQKLTAIGFNNYIVK